MDIIKEWVSNLFIIILALTFIEILLPDSSISKYFKIYFFSDNHGYYSLPCHLSDWGILKKLINIY